MHVHLDLSIMQLKKTCVHDAIYKTTRNHLKVQLAYKHWWEDDTLLNCSIYEYLYTRPRAGPNIVQVAVNER